MRSPITRVLLVVLALAALAGGSYQALQIDGRIRDGQTAGAAFETQVRAATQSLAAIAAAQRGYVAEGQNAGRWQTQVTAMIKAAGPQLSDLRLAVRTPEAQGALETAIETMASFGQADTKARGYVGSGQKLSASDVIFADGYDLLSKAAAAIEDARARETADRMSAAAQLRMTQLYYLGGAGAVVILILFALARAPQDSPSSSQRADERVHAGPRGGLGLSQPSGRTATSRPAGGGAPVAADSTTAPARQQQLEKAWIARTKELGVAADICSAMARVQDPAELPALLERVAGVLNATGVVVWMPEGAMGFLQPVLAHGYQPATLARMGTIAPDAENATVTAYQTRTPQSIPATPTIGGALVVPLITSDGCTGTMAVEFNKGVEPTDHARAVATILAAQLATLITPAPAPAPPPLSPARRDRG